METNEEWIEWIKSETKRKCERVNLKYEIKYDVTFIIDLFFPNIISKVRLHFVYMSKKKNTRSYYRICWPCWL